MAIHGKIEHLKTKLMVAIDSLTKKHNKFRVLIYLSLRKSKFLIFTKKYSRSKKGVAVYDKSKHVRA